MEKFVKQLGAVQNQESSMPDRAKPLSAINGNQIRIQVDAELNCQDQLEQRQAAKDREPDKADDQVL